jgi:DNA topoisomerase IB
MARLRRVDCAGPGIARRRRGRGFEYLDARGRRVEDEEVLARIGELAVPPAWREVWICPHPRGHLQATGIDAAGRKQYLYHSDWRAHRDRRKFERMLEFARAMPVLRAAVAEHLEEDELTRERVLACAVRLLDRGLFRIGGEGYAEQNETYGLATLLKRHVKLERGGRVRFDYLSKGGQRRVQAVVDQDVYQVIEPLKRRRGGGPELLAYRSGRRWTDVRSVDVNDYIRGVTGGEFTAKDFRTWNATVLAAAALAATPPARSAAARKRAVAEAVRRVAEQLGNTPTVSRNSYIDPRVLDRYAAGRVIPAADLAEELAALADPLAQEKVERAVLELLDPADG